MPSAAASGHASGSRGGRHRPRCGCRVRAQRPCSSLGLAGVHAFRSHRCAQLGLSVVQPPLDAYFIMIPPSAAEMAAAERSTRRASALRSPAGHGNAKRCSPCRRCFCLGRGGTDELHEHLARNPDHREEHRIGGTGNSSCCENGARGWVRAVLTHLALCGPCQTLTGLPAPVLEATDVEVEVCGANPPIAWPAPCLHLKQRTHVRKQSPSASTERRHDARSS